MSRVVGLLLRFFPPGFRDRYGADVVDLVGQQSAEVRRREGLFGVLRLWAFQMSDLGRAAWAERRAERHPSSLPSLRSATTMNAPVSPHGSSGRGGRLRGLPGAFAQDARYAVRMLWSAPVFTAVAVVTLALGIGATTAIFTVIDGVLLTPLPYDDPDELVAVYLRVPSVGQSRINHTSSTFLTFRDRNTAFDAIGAWRAAEVPVTGFDEPEQVSTVMVTEGVLPALRAQPFLGRGFAAEDALPEAPQTVILGNGYWQRRFGGDEAVIGETIHIAGFSAQIIGVMPSGFLFLSREPALYVPIQLDANEMPSVLSFDYHVLGRLGAGVSIDEANRDLDRLIPVSVERYAWIPADQLEEWNLESNVRPLKEEVVRDIGSTLWVLFGTVSLVLVMACANVANLFLVRAEGRRREIAVRTAVGASRGQLTRQFLVESVILAVLGGAAGLAVAYASLPGLMRLAPSALPRLDEIAIDPTVLLFTLAVASLSGMIFGLFPIAYYGSPDLVPALKEGGHGSGTERRRHRVRTVLVVGEVALALVLLIGAGLMIRSFQALRVVDPGFKEPGQALTFRLTVPPAEVSDDEAIAVYEQILDQVSRIPGVTEVGAISGLTMEGRSNQNSFLAEGVPVGEGGPRRGAYKAIAGDYFGATGVPILAGRSVTWDDIRNRRPVGLITETLAREFWGEPSAALGKRLRHSGNDPWREIIGVVGDVRDGGLRSAPRAVAYWPVVVEDFLGFDVWVRREMAFVVRTEGRNPLDVVPDVRRAVWSVNRNLPLADIGLLEDLIARDLAPTSFMLAMLGIAAGVAVLLGTVGIYGVISYVFSQRTHEIGVRVALGATHADVRRMVLRQGAVVGSAGVAIGLVSAVGLTRFLSAFLYGVGSIDVATYAFGAVTVAGVALLASYLPARRAMRVDPLDSLRQ